MEQEKIQYKIVDNYTKETIKICDSADEVKIFIRQMAMKENYGIYRYWTDGECDYYDTDHVYKIEKIVN